jgi:hypothetical protein
VRIRIRDGDFSFHARVSTHVALPSFGIQEGSPRLRNFLGFDVHKTNHTDNRRG